MKVMFEIHAKIYETDMNQNEILPVA